MIHGLSKYSKSGAGAGLDYFMDSHSYNDQSEQWEPREPLPVLLEGDVELMRSLCEGLEFAHKYTSGVLSFSPEETERLAQNPELKEQIIQDFKDFAFAGIDNPDSRLMCMVEHTHTGRLELHYLIPRVHAESGKYFNPFPPNYNGKRGPGNNDVFIRQNDSFVDHVCHKYGLQNPRDPQFRRGYKPPQFEVDKETGVTLGVDRKSIIKRLDKMIEEQLIGGRDDMISYLKESGATITRKGDDYFSYKFPGMDKAVRLKGDLYGKHSFETVRQGLKEASERFETARAGIGSRYSESLAERSTEVSKRHRIAPEKAQRSRDFDGRATARIAMAKSGLSELKDRVGNFAPGIRRSARDFVNQNPLSIKLSSAQIACVGQGVDPDTGVGPALTGDPVIDEFARKMHAHWKKLLSESLRLSLQYIKLSSEQANATSKRLSNLISDLFKVNVSVYSGCNFVHPGNPIDLSSFSQLLGNRPRDIQRDLTRIQRQQSMPATTRPALGALEAYKRLNAGSELPHDTKPLVELIAASREAAEPIERAQKKRTEEGTDLSE